MRGIITCKTVIQRITEIAATKHSKMSLFFDQIPTEVDPERATLGCKEVTLTRHHSFLIGIAHLLVRLNVLDYSRGGALFDKVFRREGISSKPNAQQQSRGLWKEVFYILVPFRSQIFRLLFGMTILAHFHAMSL